MTVTRLEETMTPYEIGMWRKAVRAALDEIQAEADATNDYSGVMFMVAWQEVLITSRPASRQ